MQKSYTKNYLKIYLWQGVSLILNFLSMFIVVPYLTSEPVIYGIYTVCISISIFLAYADLGFMGAGQKYAAEHFARAEKKEEIKVIGFTAFILFVFLTLFSLVFLYLSFSSRTNYKKPYSRSSSNCSIVALSYLSSIHSGYPIAADFAIDFWYPP